MSKNKKEEIQKNAVDAKVEDLVPENENPVPETPETNDVPAVEVKKNFIEKFCDKRYEKRVQRATDKAAKAEDPKPKKKPNWKLLAGIGAGIGALAVGAAAFTDAIRNSDDSETEDEDVNGIGAQDENVQGQETNESAE